MNEGEDSTSFTTGHAEVDQAMAAIGELGDSDLATHAATFERAHDALRRALTEAPIAED